MAVRVSVIDSEFGDEVKKSYLDYAMSAIISRALPDIRDGLKPVHRRILYAAFDRNNYPDKPHVKSAKVVGDVIGNYHPHGDLAVYGAIANMAQPFSQRYPLIDGQGNFGSQDGDPPAAMRYTEMRLSKMAMDVIGDLDKKPVPELPNFDGTLMEPEVLPSRLPTLFINGTAGIAVGMATSIPSHNLVEMVNAVIALIDSPDLTVSELMAFVPGPDFPTGGIIVTEPDQILSMYENGRGSIQLRSRYTTSKNKDGSSHIIISELPYEVNKSNFISSIAEWVKNKKIEYISDVRDESDREIGVRVVIDVKKGFDTSVVANNLIKHTDFQKPIFLNMMAIVDGRPELMNLRSGLQEFIKFRLHTMRASLEYDLAQARARAHILEGYVIAANNLDGVVKIVKESESQSAARETLSNRYSLSAVQAQAILDMKIGRLSRIDMDSIEKELGEKKVAITRIEGVLSSDRNILGRVKWELKHLQEKYKDPRRTQIGLPNEEFTGTSKLDLIQPQDFIIGVDSDGNFNRRQVDARLSGNRGGMGVKLGSSVQDDESILHSVVKSNTHDVLFIYTRYGKVFVLETYRLCEGPKPEKAAKLLKLQDGDQVVSLVSLRREQIPDQQFLLFTNRGVAKRVEAKALMNARTQGVIVMGGLSGENQLTRALAVSPQGQIVMASSDGQVVRTQASNIRLLGRSAQGDLGIKLANGCSMVSAGYIDEPDEWILALTSDGKAKRTPIEGYRMTGKRASGVKAVKSGVLAAAIPVGPKQSVLVFTKLGKMLSIKAETVRIASRTSSGVKLIKLASGDEVVSAEAYNPEIVEG